ncbi:DUF4435 domain-containing protein [Acinetobacter baumannii]|uniref:DUF4435 domain-containing protein n=1 Tax=Acinetobacter baumannii TaxID=470 RepID=UPI003B42C023
MSRVQAMAQARQNISVKYTEFMRIIAKNKFPVCFEGEDEKYYSVRLSNLFSLDWVGINCGGKSKVIGLRKKIRESEAYSKKKVLFFIDHDFDNNDEVREFNDIYITPCYSIENFYFSEEVFKRILKSEFNIGEYDENNTCYSNAINSFKKVKIDFINAITDFNNLIYFLRKKEVAGELHTNLNINNIDIDDLVGINLEGVEKKYNIREYRNIFPELPENLQIDLNYSIDYFQDKCKEKYFRGKQNLEFLRVFLTALKQDRGKKTDRKIFCEKGRVKLQLSKANIVSELSQYADTPVCLKEFLENDTWAEVA